MRKLLIALVMVLSIGATGVVYAPDFYKGAEAYKSGDYATALRIFGTLAERGDESAQSHLGLMYENGHGVPQDITTALMWLTISLMGADPEATPNARTMESKARIIAKLSPSRGMYPPEFDELITLQVQINVVEAELMATRCVLSHYRNCG